MTEGSASEKMRAAFEEVLRQFNVTLEPIEEEESDKKIDRYGDYSEIISKTQHKLDELNEKGEELLKRTGMTREDLEIYATNPANFTPEQWEALQNLRSSTEEFKRQTYALVGKEKEVKTIERKQKKQQHRFGKKKHWIPL